MTLKRSSVRDVAELRSKYPIGKLTSLGSYTIGLQGQSYGCNGSISALPFEPGDGAKAAAQYTCTGKYNAVAEIYASAGSNGVVEYKAFQGRNNYQMVQKSGKTFCSASALISIIDPGSVTISGGVTVGGEIMKTVTGNLSLTQSVTYQNVPKVTYTRKWPEKPTANPSDAC